MTLTVSPYLTSPPGGRSPQPANDSAGAQQKPAAADSPKDSISLSPAAQQALGGEQKTPLQSALETILTAVKNATGPTLNFGSATNASTGKNLDQSC